MASFGRRIEATLSGPCFELAASLIAWEKKSKFKLLLVHVHLLFAFFLYKFVICRFLYDIMMDNKIDFISWGVWFSVISCFTVWGLCPSLCSFLLRGTCVCVGPPLPYLLCSWTFSFLFVPLLALRLNLYVYYTYICIRGYTSVSIQVPVELRRRWIPWAGSTGVCELWVPGAKLQSSARAAPTANHWASLQPAARFSYSSRP